MAVNAYERSLKSIVILISWIRKVTINTSNEWPSNRTFGKITKRLKRNPKQKFYKRSGPGKRNPVYFRGVLYKILEKIKTVLT